MDVCVVEGQKHLQILIKTDQNSILFQEIILSPIHVPPGTKQRQQM